MTKPTVSRIAALFALGSGLALTLWSFAIVLRARNPELAYRMAWFDGRSAALAAQSLLSVDATQLRRDQADAFARKSLRLDGTSWEAAAAIGMNADIGGRTARAEEAFDFADALTRRSLLVQLWQIEHAVKKNDVPAAVRRYDLALRTSEVAPTVLIAQLSSAIDDESIRKALVSRLRADPPWGREFVIKLAMKAPNPSATSLLFQDLERAQYAISRSSWTDLILQLLENGSDKEAWQAYRFKARGARFEASRDPNFANHEVPALPFDWATVTGQGVETAIEGGDGMGQFSFALDSDGGGILLQQWQILPPGRYRLNVVNNGLQGSRTEMPYFSLTCQNGPEIGRLQLSSASASRQEIAGEFVVPDCKTQLLALIAPKPQFSSTLEGVLTFVRLEPIKSDPSPRAN